MPHASLTHNEIAPSPFLQNAHRRQYGAISQKSPARARLEIAISRGRDDRRGARRVVHEGELAEASTSFKSHEPLVHHEARHVLRVGVILALLVLLDVLPQFQFHLRVKRAYQGLPWI